MKNRGCGPDDKVARLIKQYGSPQGFTSPFGSIVHFPQSKNKATFVFYSDGEIKRLHGFEKRLLLSLFTVAQEPKARPLPQPNMN